MIPGAAPHGILIRWGLGIFLLAGVMLAIWIHGHRAGQQGEAAAHAQTRAETAQLLASLADKTAHTAELSARARELTHAALAEAQTNYTKGVYDGKTLADDLVHGLRAGTLQLRSQLSRERAASATTAAIAGSAGGSNAACPSGLSDADAEFLIRESSRADGVVQRLTLAQSYIRALLAENERLLAEWPR